MFVHFLSSGQTLKGPVPEPVPSRDSFRVRSLLCKAYSGQYDPPVFWGEKRSLRKMLRSAESVTPLSV
jgi:hypothetical protein